MPQYTLTTDNVVIHAPIKPTYDTVLSPNAVAFTAHLARLFTPRVQELLTKREARQQEFDAGVTPDFLPATRAIREGSWKVNPLPADLLDRRVEITGVYMHQVVCTVCPPAPPPPPHHPPTPPSIQNNKGPTDAKMVINALNSGAHTFMADLEDSNCPTWHNMVQGQVNLYQAVRRTLTYNDPKTNKHYALNNKLAVLLVRPRGWHLGEKHMTVDGIPVPGAIFDFALYFYNNATELLNRGSGPYFYLPKMQSHLECRLWNDIFVEAQRQLNIPRGTIKATCLIETLPAVFEMHEFLYELREHSAGLNAGRWDYLFSFIKTQRENPAAVLPDRALVTMEAPFMRAYTQLLIQTCHARSVHAMGGMAAQIPIKNNDAANKAVMDKVRGDKMREVKDGHDGTWVAHPGLIPIAREVFDAHMPGPNQLHRLREDVCVSSAELLAVWWVFFWWGSQTICSSKQHP